MNNCWVTLATLLICFPLCWSFCSAEGDTLVNFDPGKGYIYYNEPGTVMQAARFELERPGYIRQIVVKLGGRNAKGTAVLHLFGHEGGMAAPILERDLIEPITVRKTRAGVEDVRITFARPVEIGEGQVFVGIEKLSSGTTLISDRKIKRPSCIAPPDQFYFQLFKSTRGAWRWGKHGFGVSLIVDYAPPPSHPYFKDITRESLNGDSITGNRSIAWGDIDRDGFLDLVCAGKVFRNLHGERFEDITASVGAEGIPQANMLIDIDNDGDPDILFLGATDDSAPSGSLFVNNGNGFTAHPLELPELRSVSSCSIADADGDGFLDLFIGQTPPSDGSPVANHLLINNRRLGFDDRSLLAGTPSAGNDCRGSQWVDLDNDGVLELFVAQGGAQGDELWKREENGSYANHIERSGLLAVTAGSRGRIGCHWADYNGDGVPDLLLSRRILSTDKKRAAAYTPVVRMAIAEEQAQSVYSEGAEYEEKAGGAAWGDANNDGLLDYIVTTSCGCRYAALYVQQPGGGFVRKTAEAGLTGLAAGEDAAWVDFDNDGKLDLATFVDGRLVLLRNGWSSAENSSVTVDLKGPGTVGARVDLYAGGRRYVREVAAGRGLLMQEPGRITFGIAGAAAVDSLIVRWNGGQRQRYEEIRLNSVNEVTQGGRAIAADAGPVRVTASPNPFTSVVHLSYVLPAAGRTILEIHSVDGQVVKTLVNDRQAPGAYDMTWDGRNDKGERVAPGTYVYRFLGSGNDDAGKIILVH